MDVGINGNIMVRLALALSLSILSERISKSKIKNDLLYETVKSYLTWGISHSIIVLCRVKFLQASRFQATISSTYNLIERICFNTYKSTVSPLF